MLKPESLLIEPPGARASQSGCSGNDINAVSDDAAVTAVEAQCATTGAAINGSFRPNNPLSVFNGQALAGTWTVTVSDAEASDVGSMTRFCLRPSLAAGNRVFRDGFESL